MRRPTGRWALALATSLALGLTACGGAGGSDDGEPPGGEVGAAIADVDLGPAELTPDGEQLALGDVAVIQVASSDDPSAPDYRHLTLATAVVEVAEAGPDVVADLVDAPEGTAYLVRVDHKILDGEGPGAPENLLPAFVGLREDSAALPTQHAGAGDEGFGECIRVPFDTLEPGGVGRTCLVTIAAEQRAAGAAWPGDPHADGTTPETNPYHRSPLMWRE